MEIEHIIQELINSALNAVKPANFIPDMIRLEQGVLKIRGNHYDLDQYAHIYVAAIGKAAIGMTEALDKIIHPYVTEGIILTKHIPPSCVLSSPYRILRGGHPVPTSESINGAKAILGMLDKARSDDLVLFLISGGGSALMTDPIEGISLDTYQNFCSAILGCGADIREFNILRKHLDGVKGGRLAQHAAPARQITIILSDVVGSDPDVIASGPTVPDFSSYNDALAILDRYSGKACFPEKIREIIKRGCEGQLPETLKQNDPAFASSDIFLAAENRTAAYAAAAKGTELGFSSQVLTTRLTGEASAVGAILPAFFSELGAPGLLILGGETTVSLKGNGLGGRNLETALAAVRPMAAYPGCVLATLATDGEDGPTDAAGAIVTSQTLQNSLSYGISPESFLQCNDSYHFFEKTGSLFKPGVSGTNVNDLVFLLRTE